MRFTYRARYEVVIECLCTAEYPVRPLTPHKYRITSRLNSLLQGLQLSQESCWWMLCEPLTPDIGTTYGGVNTSVGWHHICPCHLQCHQRGRIFLCLLVHQVIEKIHTIATLNALMLYNTQDRDRYSHPRDDIGISTHACILIKTLTVVRTHSKLSWPDW